MGPYRKVVTGPTLQLKNSRYGLPSEGSNRQKRLEFPILKKKRFVSNHILVGIRHQVIHTPEKLTAGTWKWMGFQVRNLQNFQGSIFRWTMFVFGGVLRNHEKTSCFIPKLAGEKKHVITWGELNFFFFAELCGDFETCCGYIDIVWNVWRGRDLLASTMQMLAYQSVVITRIFLHFFFLKVLLNENIQQAPARMDGAY